MEHEQMVRDRMHRTASRIPVEVDAENIEVAGPPALWGARARSSRGRRSPALLLAAASVALACVAVLTLQGRSKDGGGTLTSAPSPSSVSSPSEMSDLPYVAEPPDWVDDLRLGTRSGGAREGRWSSAAYAKSSSDHGFTNVVVVSAFVGQHAAMAQAVPATVADVQVQVARLGDWTAVFVPGEPSLMVSGTVPVEVLGAFVHEASTSLAEGLPKTSLDRIPVGYQRIVDATTLAEDATNRYTLTSPKAGISINEVSDVPDALLYAALSGAPLTGVRVNGDPAWTGLTTANPFGPIRFVVWSPEPGVVFEITSPEADHNIDDLVALASATSAIPASKWHEIYG